MNIQINANVPIFKEIDALVSELKTYHFCSVDEYNKKIGSGELVKKPVMAADFEFADKNPGHPLTLNVRMKRIRCGDDILRKVRELDGVVPDQTLAGIHELLFDCCPTIRLSMAEALSIIPSKDSIPSLKRLAETETESPMVKNAAAQALAACENFAMKA